jgi:hypothetical protein
VTRDDLAARREHALTHPLNRADGDITPYRTIHRHATGLLLVAVLAVDR